MDLFHRCGVCLFYGTKSIWLITNHVRRHRKIARNSQEVFNCSSDLDKYKCVECDYQTSFKVNLTRHVCSSNRQSENDCVKTYNYENCDFQTSSYLLLGKHVYYDCKNVISDCDQKLLNSCGNNDESKENIDCFEKEIDKGDRNEIIKNELYCGHCSYKTESKRESRKHIYREHLSTERSNILNKSIDDRHRTEKINWFKCKHCSFQTKQKFNLKRHIFSKHTATEKVECFKCEKCSYKCKRKGHLKCHILMKHTDPEKVKWFECENCTFQGKRKDHLNKHILSKHTASERIEWFKCNLKE